MKVKAREHSQYYDVQVISEHKIENGMDICVVKMPPEVAGGYSISEKITGLLYNRVYYSVREAESAVYGLLSTKGTYMYMAAIRREMKRIGGFDDNH